MFDLTEIKPGFHIRIKEMFPEQVEEAIIDTLGNTSAIVRNNILRSIGKDVMACCAPWQSMAYGLLKTTTRQYNGDSVEERDMYLLEGVIEYITDDNGVVVYHSDQSLCVQEESIEDSSDLSEFIESFTLNN